MLVTRAVSVVVDLGPRHRRPGSGTDVLCGDGCVRRDAGGAAEAWGSGNTRHRPEQGG